MRFFKGFIFSLIFIGVLGGIVLPPLIGLVIKQRFFSDSMVFPGQKTNGEIKEYKLGWFSSDITTVRKISDPTTVKIFVGYGIPAEDIPKTIVLISKSHMQHGPFFYSVAKGRDFFGFAYTDSQWFIQPEQRNFFAYLGLTDKVMPKTAYRVGFSGAVTGYLELVNYSLLVPGTQAIVKLASIHARIYRDPSLQRIQAAVSFKNFSWQSAATVFALPNVGWTADVRKDKQGFWIGKQSLSLPAMTLDQGGEEYTLNDVRLGSFLNETSGLLNGEKDLSFKKMQFEQEVIGPFHLQISAARINAQALENLMITYKEISEEGELYQSQLKQKLLAILPHVVTADATIKINNFDIATPYGAFMFKAQLSWPRENFNSPNSMEELMQASASQASMRISTALTKQVINVLSELFFTYQLDPDDKVKLAAMQDEIQFNMQQNSAAVIDLIQTSQLTKEDSLSLLSLIRNRASLQDYSAQIKKLFLEKKLTVTATYLLNWLYAPLADITNLYDKNRNNLKESVKNLYYARLNAYITSGFLVREHDDYVFLFQREKDGIVKINGVKTS